MKLKIKNMLSELYEGYWDRRDYSYGCWNLDVRYIVDTYKKDIINAGKSWPIKKIL